VFVSVRALVSSEHDKGRGLRLIGLGSFYQKRGALLQGVGLLLHFAWGIEF
jgi:hypothetical protein